MLFDFTSSVLCADGSTQYMVDSIDVPSELLNEDENPTTDSYRGLFERTVKKFADQAYRTLLITYKDMSMSEYENIKSQNNDFAKESDKEVLENGLIAIGIFGLQDPLRDTIVSSIEKCKNAGIQVIMCTGDNIDTAIAISKNAGIVTKEQLQASKFTAMTGKEFREAVGGLKQVDHPDKKDVKIDVVANMKEFRKIKEHLRVLARSSPEDKYILVTGIQDCAGVVAVTGDGTNDAPALTKADVGFSMGITGTDVAKGASDIILLDDNFSSIVVALKYGRNVYDNVRKFLQFQLTVNVVAMFIVFFGSVILKDSPLTAVQMLWVNLIMDTFAALALATEPPQDDILDRQPYKKDAAIVTPIMWRNVFGHAIYQAIVIVVIIFAGQSVLCHPYDQLTLADGKINPFFTSQHYETQTGIDTWVTKDFTAE
jgi:Ca2+ transporting ATPase